MFTFVVNNDTMKVIGLINPCHKPSQKPAGSGPVSTSSFGPAAQAASRSAVPESSKTHLALDLIDKRPPQSFSVGVYLNELTSGWTDEVTGCPVYKVTAASVRPA